MRSPKRYVWYPGYKSGRERERDGRKIVYFIARVRSNGSSLVFKDGGVGDGEDEQ